MWGALARDLDRDLASGRQRLLAVSGPQRAVLAQPQRAVLRLEAVPLHRSEASQAVEAVARQAGVVLLAYLTTTGR